MNHFLIEEHHYHHQAKSINGTIVSQTSVSLIKGAPKAAHNRGYD
jgi:hypothetical protein